MVVLRKDGFVSLTNSTPYANMAENIGWPALNGLVEQGHILWLRIVLQRY